MIFSQKHWTPATISTSNNISTCHSQGAMSLTVIISQHATHRALKWYFHRNIEHQQLYPPVIITFNMPLCTPLIETSHRSQHYVRYKVTWHGAPERKSVGMQDGWNAQMHTIVDWAWEFRQSSQMSLRVISWAVVVPPPELGFWRRLLKEDLGRIIRVNIPAHIHQQLSSQRINR